MKTTEKYSTKHRAIIAIAIVLAICGSIIVSRLRAGSQLVMGSMTSITNTTVNFSGVAIGTFTFPGGSLFVQHGTLTNTNDMKTVVSISLDNNNWVPVSTNYPTGTNNNGADFYTGFVMPPIYLRTSVTTTNAAPGISVGGTFTQ